MAFLLRLVRWELDELGRHDESVSHTPFVERKKHDPCPHIVPANYAQDHRPPMPLADLDGGGLVRATGARAGGRRALSPSTRMAGDRGWRPCRETAMAGGSVGLQPQVDRRRNGPGWRGCAGPSHRARSAACRWWRRPRRSARASGRRRARRPARSARRCPPSLGVERQADAAPAGAAARGSGTCWSRTMSRVMSGDVRVTGVRALTQA